MKYSVIVPYYKAEKFLRRCCDSLMAQKGDFEFLLISDETDADNESDDIAREYVSKDERFVVIWNQHEKGVSGARNTGIDHAHGDWVTFLDADDEMLPNAWKIFGHMTKLDETANIIQANHLRHYKKLERTVLRYNNEAGVYHMEELPQQWCMVWNKLIRRDFLDDVRFVEGLQYGEDEIFNLDMLAKDDRIFHTKKSTTTILRHFDNKESLSHIKDRAGLIAQARALEDFIMRCENPTARLTACRILGWHWTTPTYEKAFGGDNMRYVIMCGGHYPNWQTPRQLLKLNGEELVARTIRLLHENGVREIAISTDNPAFEKFGVPILTHDNSYTWQSHKNCTGDWVDCFYPTDEPTCYLFGDVVFSPDAIRTIVRKQTNDVELFGSAEPFAQDYPKKYVEPFAFKVVNTEHFRRAIQMAKEKRNESWRTPIAWELWSLIKGRRIDVDDYRADYTIINDYTCDVDFAPDLKKFAHISDIKLE